MSATNTPPTILYQGLLRSPASWARVGRGYLGGFGTLGHQVSAVSTRGFRHDPDFPLPRGIQEVSAREAHSGPRPDFGLGFLHPPHLERLIGRRRANLFVWESDRAPPQWIRPLREHTDLVLVPSEFGRQTLENSGLPREQIAVVPYGHDVAMNVPRPPRQSAFVFLLVLSPHRRKGVSEALTAFAKAFRAGDPVLLLIKSTYDPGTSKRRFPFEIPSWKTALSEAGLLESGAPRWELDLSTRSDEDTLNLFRRADVYLNPSWGEAFGLAVLEAMACGTPAITTGWSGPLDFFPESEDLLDFDLVEAGEEALYEPVEGARVARPRVEALTDRLRWHFENSRASRELGQVARKHVQSWTWTNAAKRLLDRLQLTPGSEI